MSRLWCRLILQHRGHVGWVESGPFWMCDNCGEVFR